MQTRVFFILIFLFIMLFPMRVNSQIVTGAEQMDQYLPLLKGKRVGMVVVLLSFHFMATTKNRPLPS